MLLASLVVLLRCAMALAHALVAISHRRADAVESEGSAPPLVVLSELAAPFVLALITLFVARGLAHGSWGLPEGLPGVFAVCAVVAWAAWVAWAAGRWLPMLAPRAGARPLVVNAAVRCAAAGLVGVGVTTWRLDGRGWLRSRGFSPRPCTPYPGRRHDDAGHRTQDL